MTSAICSAFEFFAVGNVIEIFIGDEEDLLSGVRDGVSSAVHENILFLSTLLSGVYRIEVKLDGVLKPDEFDLIDEWTLRLPKGELSAFTSGVKRLGSLVPGVYRAQIGWSSYWEGKHALLESEHDYPPNDGPDGRVVLTWLGPC